MMAVVPVPAPARAGAEASVLPMLQPPLAPTSLLLALHVLYRAVRWVGEVRSFFFILALRSHTTAPKTAINLPTPSLSL